MLFPGEASVSCDPARRSRLVRSASCRGVAPGARFGGKEFVSSLMCPVRRRSRKATSGRTKCIAVRRQETCLGACAIEGEGGCPDTAARANAASERWPSRLASSATVAPSSCSALAPLRRGRGDQAGRPRRQARSGRSRVERTGVEAQPGVRSDTRGRSDGGRRPRRPSTAAARRPGTAVARRPGTAGGARGLWRWPTSGSRSASRGGSACRATP